MDDDLGILSREQLVVEVRRLRAGIRAHRDSTDHDLCWHHPALWRLLPEPLAQDVAVPAWPQFLRGCIRYRQSLDEQLPDARRTSHELEEPLDPPHLRLARPVSDVARARSMYGAGLGLRVLGAFEDHEGFDGVMLGAPGAPYHLEFTSCSAHPGVPRPSEEELIVLYVPDRVEWERRCGEMRAAGFRQVTSSNPYWEVRGCTFQDPDGYRVVLERAAWDGAAAR